MILPSCTILSALLEFAQIWFPPRFTSLDDVVAETIGAWLGICFWLMAGRRLTAIIRQFWATYAVHNWSIRLIPGYLLFLVFVNGMPFDLTLSPSVLKRKDNAHMILRTPFTVVSGDEFDLIRRALINAAWFMPAGILMAGLPLWRLRGPAAGVIVFFAGFALAGTIEFMQLFVMSCAFDSTDIITGSWAVLGGWCIMRKWRDCHEAPGGFSNGLGAFLFLAWVAELIFINWEPFDFRIDSAFLTGRWQQVSLVPFTEYYGRNYLHSLNDMLQKTLLFMPVGLLLSQTTASRFNWAIVVGFAFLFALILETGQFFLPQRHPVVSDVLVETFGAWLGLVATNHLRHLIASTVSGGEPGA